MLPVTKLLCKYKFSLKAISVIIFAAVCITNIYYSSLLSDHFTSPHEYLRRELIAGKPPIVVINFSAAAQSNDFDTEYDVDQNKLDSLQAAVIADYQEYNVIVRGEVRNVPLWLRRLHKKANISSTFNYRSDPGDGGKYYFLTELLQVRIYDKDKSRWTIRELKQWIHYMLLAGVEHIFICDHFEHDSERLDRALQKYIDVGLVTYIAWNAVSRNAMWAQIRCYQRLVKRYRRRHKWQIAVDMDEYPFALNDTKENFLVRYLEQLPDSVSEVFT